MCWLSYPSSHSQLFSVPDVIIAASCRLYKCLWVASHKIKKKTKKSYTTGQLFSVIFGTEWISWKMSIFSQPVCLLPCKGLLWKIILVPHSGVLLECFLFFFTPFTNQWRVWNSTNKKRFVLLLYGSLFRSTFSECQTIILAPEKALAGWRSTVLGAESRFVFRRQIKILLLDDWCQLMN